jgi:hypothetical protein
MINENIKIRLDNMLSVMKLPDGTPLVPVDAIDALINMGFFTAPASTKYHGAVEGGLFQHSLNVTYALVQLTNNLHLTWNRPESPYIVGMFHDLCKCDQYKHPVVGETLGGDKIENESAWEYRKDTLLRGHGDKSVMLLSQFYKLTEEEIMCIRYHMGAFTDKDEWTQYTGAIHKYPNVLWTHTADMIAAHIVEV